MREVPVWLIVLRSLGLILACVGLAMMVSVTKDTIKEVSSAKLAQAEGTNYTVEIDEQDGSAVVYVENHEAITEAKDGLRIRKKGEE